MTDDAKILAALQTSSEEVLKLLFDAYSDRIYRLGLHLLQDPIEAEDVVQETFLKALLNLDSFKGRSKLGTWLYRIAYNHAMDRLRARPKAESTTDLWDDDESSLPMPQVFVDWDTPEALLMTSETVALLDRAVQEIPTSLRSVFVLRDIEELSTRETAEILGLSEGAVKVRLHRARLALREILATNLVQHGSGEVPADGM